MFTLKCPAGKARIPLTEDTHAASRCILAHGDDNVCFDFDEAT